MFFLVKMLTFRKGERFKSFLFFFKFRWYNIIIFLFLIFIFSILRLFSIIFYIYILIFNPLSLKPLIFDENKKNWFIIFFYRVVFIEPGNNASYDRLLNNQIKLKGIYITIKQILKWLWFGYWEQIFLFCTCVLEVESCESQCYTKCQLFSDDICMKKQTICVIWLETIKEYCYTPIYK